MLSVLIAMPNWCTRILKAKSKGMELTPLTSAGVKATASLWYRGWALGHLGVVPDALAQLRTLDDFEARLLARMDTAWIAGPPDAPDGFVRIIGDEVDQFYVEPDAVGRGLGRRLIQATQAKMHDAGVVRAWLWCAAGNARGEGFYTAMGWENCGVHQAALETSGAAFHLDVIRFEKTLD